MADLICDEVLTVEQETSAHLQSENEMSNMGKFIKVQLFWEDQRKFKNKTKNLKKSIFLNLQKFMLFKKKHQRMFKVKTR